MCHEQSPALPSRERMVYEERAAQQARRNSFLLRTQTAFPTNDYSGVLFNRTPARILKGRRCIFVYSYWWTVSPGGNLHVHFAWFPLLTVGRRPEARIPTFYSLRNGRKVLCQRP